MRTLLGTVSHGTMRTQDLIPAFLDALAEVDSSAYEQIMVCQFSFIPDYVMDEGDGSEWWNSEDASYKLDDLFDALDAAAPEGCYFGAHPGDGSDYGFWAIED
jgi:hypothetical protein